MHIPAPQNNHADVVIVGTGAGASVVAKNALKSGYSVLMVEQGIHHTEADVKTSKDSFTKMWRGCGLTAGLGKPPIAYAEGVCVGGTTEINSAIYQIPYRQTIDGWVSEYNLGDDWRYDNLKPYYDRVFAYMSVSETHPHFEDTEILFKGGKKCGYKVEHLPRAMDVTASLPPRTYACPTRGKQTMSRTLLPDAFRSGATCLTDCWVHKIHTKNRRATHITAVQNGKKRIVKFDKLFVCGGSIQTPALLHRSSIRKNIGTTLQLHPTIKVVARFDQVVQTGESMVPTAAVTEFLPDIRIGGSVFDTGFLAMGIANNYHHTAILMHNPAHIGSYYTMIKPQGSGRVMAIPFIKEPFVKYALTKQDFKNLQQGILYTAQVLFHAGANLIFPDIAEHSGWTHIDQAITDLQTPIKPANFNPMSIHLMASCRPGGSAETSATDPNGKVWGFDNIYICDASQIPTALGVNPQASVMAISEHHTQRIFD